MKEKRPMPYPLRMPDEMRQTLETACRESGRSMNAEIILRLERSLSEGGGLDPVPTVAALKEEVKQEILDELVGLIREAIEDAVTESCPEKEE